MRTWIILITLFAMPLMAQNTDIEDANLPKASETETPDISLQPKAPDVAQFTTRKDFEDFKTEINYLVAPKNVIDRAETYYNNRFNDLLWVIGIAAGVVTFVIPYILKLQQKHDFKKLLAAQNKEFSKKLKCKEEELIKMSNEQLEQTKCKLKCDIDDTEQALRCTISKHMSFLFANLAMSQEDTHHLLAIPTYISAAIEYITYFKNLPNEEKQLEEIDNITTQINLVLTEATKSLYIDSSEAVGMDTEKNLNILELSLKNRSYQLNELLNSFDNCDFKEKINQELNNFKTRHRETFPNSYI